jgi:hypothetical protein
MILIIRFNRCSLCREFMIERLVIFAGANQIRFFLRRAQRIRLLMCGILGNRGRKLDNSVLGRVRFPCVV